MTWLMRSQAVLVVILSYNQVDEHGHYIYAGVGWEKNVTKWFYANFIHVDVKSDGRVWIQHDGTDLKIADRLVSEGIDKKDIVIGFHPPHARA